MKIPHFRIQGHIYFVTSVVYNRLPIFTRAAYITALYDSLNYYRYQHSFKLLGYVFMPEHFHVAIWPFENSGLDDIMRDFKTFTAKRIIRQAEVECNEIFLKAFQTAGIETNRSYNKVWQDCYWDTNIYTEYFLRQKLNYIHRNPVRANLVTEPSHYAYSSYRNYSSNDQTMIEIDRDWQSIPRT